MEVEEPVNGQAKANCSRFEELLGPIDLGVEKIIFLWLRCILARVMTRVIGSMLWVEWQNINNGWA